ncbi:MAG: B12-binding domain-containing radical SAM protein [Clostridiales bacterium]|nr:B12-binding domain-containing radical SAM protein [Clostridiales bacterium]
MKVLLINAEPYHIKHKSAIPLGLLSIATFLKKHGHEVKVYDRTVNKTSLKKQLKVFEAEIVGISAPSFKAFDDAVKVSHEIKKRDIPLVWGGAISSLVPEIVLKTGLVDFVVMGEGEITFLDLIEKVGMGAGFESIDGLAYLKDGEVVINKDRDFADLSDLPIIDFSFVNPEDYFVENFGCKKMLHIYASKGCISKCTYCYNPYYSKCVWRPRPAQYYLSEIKYLIENHGMDGVCFADDLLVPNKKLLLEFVQGIIDSGLDFIWGGEFRADLDAKESLRLLYDSGCRWLYFGIESGSPKRQDLIKKKLNLEKAKDLVSHCAKVGIATSASFIMNYPDSDVKELQETISYMNDLGADILLASFYGPIPKSEIYEDLLEKGKMEAPKNYKEWRKIKMMDLIGENFSDIPLKDLKVISAHYLMRNFLWKDPQSEKNSRLNFKKAFMRVLDLIAKGGLDSIKLLFIAAGEFLHILYYAKAYPGILKKYSLKGKE